MLWVGYYYAPFTDSEQTQALNWFIPMVQNQRMKAHPPEPERVGPGRSFLTLVVKRAVPVRSLVSVAHWTIPEPVIGTAL